MLCDTPEILSDKSLSTISNTGNKSKGTRANDKIIGFGEQEALAWLDPEHKEGEEPPIRGIDTTKSTGLLRELIGYSRDINTDRVSALIMLMILRADRDRITIVSKTQSIKTKSSDSMWKRAYNKHYNLGPNISIKNGSLNIGGN